jgi:tight adherence protein C
MTMLPIIASLLVFAAVAAASYATWIHVSTEKSPVAVRLRELRSQYASRGPVVFSERPPLVLKLLADLGGFLPANEGRNAMRTGLIRAGYRRPDAVVVFLGCKILFAALLPLLWIMIGWITARPIGNVFTWSIILAIAGFYLPTLFIGVKKGQRHDAILSSLPDALDLMVVCVESGLGVAAALQHVAIEVHLASPELSDELALVNQQMQTGISRTDALRNFAERTGVDDVYSLVAMLVQTDRLGTSVAQSLRAHAESMRTRRRQRAEQLARKASIKLAFPLVFLILPALLVVILGPAGIQLVRALVAGE